MCADEIRTKEERSATSSGKSVLLQPYYPPAEVSAALTPAVTDDERQDCELRTSRIGSLAARGFVWKHLTLAHAYAMFPCHLRRQPVASHTKVRDVSILSMEAAA